MGKQADIAGTEGPAHDKPGDARPAWPRDWRRGSVLRSLAYDLFAVFEFATRWYYYLFGNIASFRFLVQLSAVMLFAFGVYGVTMDIEKRHIDRGVREASLFAMIARTQALPDGSGSRALKSSVEALARDGVAMKEIDLSGADLRGADLAGANFRRADLRDATLIEADLTGADLRGARLGGAILTRAILAEADICEADLTGADLTGAVLEAATLEKANLGGADLLVTDFSHADLADALVTSANGAYANFAGANLSGASFADTELQGAVLDGADIGGTRLQQAYNLSDTQIGGACVSSHAAPLLPEHLEWSGRPC